MRRRTSLALALACSLVACGEDELTAVDVPSCAQFLDGHWDQRLVGRGVYGMRARVIDLERMPDGSVIAGGVFVSMSGTAARNVARWDGAMWSPLGRGLPGRVISLAVDDTGQLWAVGQALQPTLVEELAESSYLAQWTGTDWTIVLEDVNAYAGVTPIDGGIALYGSFFEAGGVPAHGIALLRAGAWSAITSEGSYPAFTTAVRSGSGLCANDAQGGISCWDGSTWTALGRSPPSSTAFVQGNDGTWYAGQRRCFSTSTCGIMRLEANGEWRSLDGGIAEDGDYLPGVSSIAIDGDDVIIAGDFGWVGAGAGRVRAHNLARWSPTSGWSALTPPSLWGGGSALLVADDQVFVGGGFVTIGEDAGAGIATIVDGTVHSVPPRPPVPARLGQVYDLVERPEGIVLAGHFKTSDEPDTRFVVEFDGEWHPREPAVADAGDMSVTGISLGSRGYAIRNGRSLVLYAPGRDAQPIVDVDVTGPLAADGSGTLFFVSEGKIGKSTSDGWSWVGRIPAPGDVVVAMAIHRGELVIVTSTRTEEGDFVYRRHDGEWEEIGAWPDGTSTLVSSPALGLVAATTSGTRVWNGIEWRLVSSVSTQDMAACSDGVVAIIDADDDTHLGFLGDVDAAWVPFGGPRGARTSQLVPTERGIYVGDRVLDTQRDRDGNVPLAFERWTTFDDSGW